jgi:hypothetical protein
MAYHPAGFMIAGVGLLVAVIDLPPKSRVSGGVARSFLMDSFDSHPVQTNK